MKTLKQMFVEYVVEEVIKNSASDKSVKILDVGCGTANYVPGLVKKFPGIIYIGIEPIETSFKKAQKCVDDIEQATVHFGLAYDALTAYEDESFDLIISLSVLEHVKRLPEFLQFCSRYLKSGGSMIHRYDLGHALHTHSWKEWMHVRLGNNLPGILPETQFVRYVPEAEVKREYEKVRVEPVRVTYHQMPNFKLLEKYLTRSDSAVMEEVFEWEINNQCEFSNLPIKVREKLLPAIAVWGRKRKN